MSRLELYEIAFPIQDVTGYANIEEIICLIPYMDRVLRKENLSRGNQDYPHGYGYMEDHPDIKTVFDRLLKALDHMNDIVHRAHFQAPAVSLNPVIMAPQISVEGGMAGSKNTVDLFEVDKMPEKIDKKPQVQINAVQEPQPQRAPRKSYVRRMADGCGGVMDVCQMPGCDGMDSERWAWGCGFLFAYVMTVLMYVISTVPIKDEPVTSLTAFAVSMSAAFGFSCLFVCISVGIEDANIDCFGENDRVYFFFLPFWISVWWTVMTISLAGAYQAGASWQLTMKDNHFVNPDLFNFQTSQLLVPFPKRPLVRWGSFEWTSGVRVAYQNVHYDSYTYDDSTTYWCMAPVLPAEYVSADGSALNPPGVNTTLYIKFWAFAYNCHIRFFSSESNILDSFGSYKTVDSSGEPFTLDKYSSTGPNYAITTHGIKSTYARDEVNYAWAPEAMAENFAAAGIPYLRMSTDYVLVDWVADLEQGYDRQKKAQSTWALLTFLWAPILAAPVGCVAMCTLCCDE